MSSLLFELGLIVRGFWQRPGFAIAATGPLELAMGANTTLFRVTDELMLQPRALIDSHKLYVLTSARREGLMSEISQLEFGGLGHFFGGPCGMVTPGEDEDQV